MGVLACSKVGCESVMCDTHVPGIGYVCRDCQESFKRWLVVTGGYPDNELKLYCQLKQYMEIEKSHNRSNLMDLDEFFNKHTRV